MDSSGLLHNFELHHLDSNPAAQQNNDNQLAPLDLDAEFLDLSAEIMPQNTEKPLSEIQLTADETLIPLAKAAEPTKSNSPRITDTKASVPCSIVFESESAAHETPEVDVGRGEDESKPEAESEQEQEEIFRFLHCKLQTGLLPTVGQPEPKEMKFMSLYLRKLESFGNPSPSVLRATRISKLFENIKILDEIPRDDEFDFKGRVAKLLEKWEPSLEEEDPATCSTKQPIDHHDIGPDMIVDEWQFADAPNSQQLLDNKSKPSAVGSAGKCASEVVVQSEHSTFGHEIEHGVAPAIKHSPPTPPLSPSVHKLPKRTPERLVIDLTSDDEADTDAGSELPRHPTSNPGVGPGVAKSAQINRSPLPSRKSSEPFSTTVRKEQAGPKSNSAKSHIKKRKRSDGPDDEQALLPAANYSEIHNKNTTPNRQRSQRKTSPWKHLTNEIQWLSGSVPKIEKMIEEAEKEICAIRKKKIRVLEETTRLLKENETEMKSAKRRMNESIELKAYLLAWGAQDEKVTEEWSPSK